MNIGNNISKLRNNMNMTQEELSKKMGISRSYLGDIENGRNSPSMKTLESISDKLGVSLDELISGYKNRNVNEKFSECLENIREENNISMRYLEKQTGISQAYISQLESGNRDTPKPDMIRRLSKGLNVTYLHLLMKAGYIDKQDIQEYINDKL